MLKFRKMQFVGGVFLKIINSILSILIIFIGSFFMSITVYNETFQTVLYKVLGFVILVGGGG